MSLSKEDELEIHIDILKDNLVEYLEQNDVIDLDADLIVQKVKIIADHLKQLELLHDCGSPNHSL